MTFRPAPDYLLPPLTPRQEMAILARTLWREGFDDHLAGHITYRQDENSFLCTPWMLLWEEVRPADMLSIDGEGRVLEGTWPVPPGIPLHLELHKARHDVAVAIHHHPRFGTIWADAGRVPGCFDQSSALGGGELVLVDEYDGPVNDPAAAARAVKAMGQADVALLANHGVFVLGRNVRAAHQRAVALEHRCRNAFRVDCLGGGRQLPEAVRALFGRGDGDGFLGFWEAMARRELHEDPTVLDED